MNSPVTRAKTRGQATVYKAHENGHNGFESLKRSTLSIKDARSIVSQADLVLFIYHRYSWSRDSQSVQYLQCNLCSSPWPMIEWMHYSAMLSFQTVLGLHILYPNNVPL